MRQPLLAACLAALPMSAFAQAEPAPGNPAADAAQQAQIDRAMAEAMAKAEAMRAATKFAQEAQMRVAAMRAAAQAAQEAQVAAAANAAQAKPADANPIADEAKKIPAAKREKIEKLMGKLKLQEAYEAQVSATFKGFHGMMKHEDQNLPKDMQKRMVMGRAAFFQFMKAALEWDKVKDRYLLLYAKHFSEEELAQTLALLERPEAQLLVKKQLDLATDGEHGLNKVQWDIFQANMKEAQKLLMNAVNDNGNGAGVVELQAEVKAFE